MATLSIDGRRGEGGQAIVELALTLPLLMLVVIGVFDFGLMLQRYEVVTNAAREGARLAALPGYSAADAQDHADRYLQAGDISGSVVHANCLPVALDPGRICTSAVPRDFTIPAGGGAPAKTLHLIDFTVTYDYEYVLVGPILSMFGNNLRTTRLIALSTMRREGT